MHTQNSFAYIFTTLLQEIPNHPAWPENHVVNITVKQLSPTWTVGIYVYKIIAFFQILNLLTQIIILAIFITPSINLLRSHFFTPWCFVPPSQTYRRLLLFVQGHYAFILLPPTSSPKQIKLYTFSICLLFSLQLSSVALAEFFHCSKC